MKVKGAKGMQFSYNYIKILPIFCLKLFNRKNLHRLKYQRVFVSETDFSSIIIYLQDNHKEEKKSLLDIEAAKFSINISN